MNVAMISKTKSAKVLLSAQGLMLLMIVKSSYLEGSDRMFLVLCTSQEKIILRSDDLPYVYAKLPGPSPTPAPKINSKKG